MIPFPHLVLVQPIEDDEPEHSLALDALREAHVQIGEILDISDVLEEAIEPGNLIVFAGWVEKAAPTRQYASWHNETLYMIHEDDIEAVLEWEEV